jgi:hypothetical protein
LRAACCRACTQRAARDVAWTRHFSEGKLAELPRQHAKNEKNRPNVVFPPSVRGAVNAARLAAPCSAPPCAGRWPGSGCAPPALGPPAKPPLTFADAPRGCAPACRPPAARSPPAAGRCLGGRTRAPRTPRCPGSGSARRDAAAALRDDKHVGGGASSSAQGACGARVARRAYATARLTRAANAQDAAEEGAAPAVPRKARTGASAVSAAPARTRERMRRGWRHAATLRRSLPPRRASHAARALPARLAGLLR